MLWENTVERRIRTLVDSVKESARQEYEARVIELDALHDGDHESWFTGSYASVPYGQDQARRNRNGTATGGYGGGYFAQYMTSLWENGQVYPVYVPILSRFSALMSTLFHRAPTFRGYLDGQELSESSTQLKRAHKLLDEVQITQRGKQAQRKSHVLKLIFGLPRYYRGAMQLDLVTADRIRVLEDPMNPGVFRDCLAVCQELQTLGDSSVTQEVRYLVWTREPQGDGSDFWGVYHVNSSGRTLENPYFPDNVNPFGRYPHVPLYSDPYHDRIFPVLDDTLHSVQVAANLAWTHIIHGVRRSDGTGILVDPDGVFDGDVQMALGGKVMHLKSEGSSFNWAEMKTDLKAMIEAIQAFIKTEAGFKGIPTEMLSIDGPKMIEALSAASKQMDRLDLIELRADQEPLWERQFADLWDSIRRVHNFYRPAEQIDANVMLQVEWNVPEIPQEPQAKAQAEAVQLANGTVSEVEIIADDRKISLEDARAARLQIIKDRALRPDDDPRAASATEKGSAQDSALNGAQMESLVGILEAVAQGRIPRDSGLATIQLGFRLTTEQAEAVMGDIGRGFVAPAEAQP